MQGTLGSASFTHGVNPAKARKQFVCHPPRKLNIDYLEECDVFELQEEYDPPKEGFIGTQDDCINGAGSSDASGNTSRALHNFRRGLLIMADINANDSANATYQESVSA